MPITREKRAIHIGDWPEPCHSLSFTQQFGLELTRFSEIFFSGGNFIWKRPETLVATLVHAIRDDPSSERETFAGLGFVAEADPADGDPWRYQVITNA